MKRNGFKVIVLVAVCALALGGQAFAGKGGGKGGGNGQQSASGQQFKVRQQLKTGDCDSSGVRQGLGQGQGSMRNLGLADGSKLAPRPKDGTGFGSSAQ
jgi:hypothetical protein